MKTEKKVMWLKIGYWTGAIADLIFGILMVFFPKVTQWFWQIEPIHGTELMWTKYFGIMVISWTALLLWGLKKPIERKGVLLLTIFPVIVGLIGVEIYSIVNSISPNFNLWLLVVLQSCIAMLMAYGLYTARDLEKSINL